MKHQKIATGRLWSSAWQESRRTFTRARVKKVLLEKVQTSAALVLSAVYLLVLQEIKSHRQTPHAKDEFSENRVDKASVKLTETDKVHVETIRGQQGAPISAMEP